MLISGGASTAASIYKAISSGELSGIEPALVIRSKESAGNSLLEAGFPEEKIKTLNRKEFNNEEEWTEKLLEILQNEDIQLIGQFGWLKKTPGIIIENYSGRIMNQHPGPLDSGRPDFGGEGMYGMRVHATRLYFVKATGREYWTEATTHFVTEEYDKGEVIKAYKVEIKEDDTPESLQKRVLPFEHKLQIDVLRDFAQNSVTITKRETPLVLPEEIEILEVCKKEAIKNYPHG